MSPFYIAAIIFGTLLIITNLLMFTTPSRKLTITFKLVFDILNILELLCIYFYNGLFGVFASLGLSVVGIVRDIVFLCRGKYKWADNICWLFIFFALIAGSLFFTYDSWISLLPVIGSFFNTGALYLYNQQHTKHLSMVGQSFFIAYFVLLLDASDLLTIMNCISSSFNFCSCIIGLSIMVFEANKIKRQNNIETNQENDK